MRQAGHKPGHVERKEAGRVGIAIKPGTGKAAERELWSFCAAYPAMQIGKKDGVLLFWIFAEDEASLYSEMEYNKFCGTFDAVAYIMEG